MAKRMANPSESKIIHSEEGDDQLHGSRCMVETDSEKEEDTQQPSSARSSSSSQLSSSNNTVDLIFDGSCNVVSSFLPANVEKESLASFMHKKDIRNLFFSAGGTRPVEDYEMTLDVRSMWKDIVTDYYQAHPSLLPQDCDSVISCDSTVQFLGLVLKTTALNGIKLQVDDNGFPVYTVVGFAEKQQVTGFRPIVWLFNQLTGNHKKEKGIFHPTSARACSKISIIQNKNMDDDVDNDDGFAFQFNVDLKVITNLPKTMIRLLPASKERVEEQGSKAVANTITKDLNATLDHVKELFLDTHHAKRTTTTVYSQTLS